MRNYFTKDYYEILQVHYNAEPEIIKAAYKRLSTKYHPDINKNPESEDIMKRINIAYGILSDPSSRAEFDRNYEQKSNRWSNRGEHNRYYDQQTNGHNNHHDNCNSTHNKKEPFNAYYEFWEAIKSGETEKVRSFIEQGADVNIQNKQGWTPLHIVVKYDLIGTLELLIAKGADVNKKNDDGVTPLHTSAYKGNIEIVKLLIGRGADVNARDKYNRTPLHWPAIKGYKKMAELLISRGAEVNSKDNDNMTPLDLAIKNGYYDIAQLLKMKGAKIRKDVINKNIFNFQLSLANYIFILISISAIVGYFIIFVSKFSNEEKLFKAITEGDTLTVIKLVNKDPNLKKIRNNMHGRSPLEYAIDIEQFDVIEVLREKGASHSINKEEFFKAVKEGDFRKVRRFIAFGADVNEKDNNGWKPLYLASIGGHAATARLLIDKGADVNANDNEYRVSPLHSATVKGHKPIIKILISKGANINLKAKGGNTPLHLAALLGDTETIELLISSGAQVNIEDNNGITPTRKASIKGHKKAKELLQKHGGIEFTEIDKNDL